MKMKNTENRGTAWYEERIKVLEEFMTPERCDILRKTLSMRTNYMTVMAENMFHGQNAAALVRHCEAFGVQQMHTAEEYCKFEPSQSVVRGTDQWVDVHRHLTTTEALQQLKQEGYRIVATTPHLEDCTPESFDVTTGRFALILGTEHAGISEEVKQEADEFLKIPMCGMVESLNVSASAAILIYTLSQRIRQQVDGWQLSEDEMQRTLYDWMYKSVKDAPQILNRRLGDPLPETKEA